MHSVDYIAIGFLLACMLLAAAKVLLLGEGRRIGWRSLWQTRGSLKL
jgi:hypothetical protein